MWSYIVPPPNHERLLTIGLKPVDITIMRHLSTLTNIIPVIAKSDSLSHTQTLTLKLSLLRDLRANSIPIFTFGKSISELERNVVNGIPWAISCLRDEIAEMDASLLMRDEAVESYVESDLFCITSTIVENAAWLRFATTKKFLEWRTKHIDSGELSTSLALSPSQSAMSIISIPSMTDGYAMARVGDHIDREERLARVRLAQWAGEMRRSVRRRMQEEREEFERVEYSDRVKWLVTRLNEAITNQQHESALVPVSTQLIRRKSLSWSSSTRKPRQTLDRDPLGLVWVKERWGPRVSKSIMWIVEAGVVLGSGWVVWKYVVHSGLGGWFMQNARTQ
jgi:septin family protein